MLSALIRFAGDQPIDKKYFKFADKFYYPA